MYNRYLQDQQGSFAPVGEETACAPPLPPPRPPEPPREDDWLRRLLSRFGMGDVDTGDLLLLLILFLLFHEGENRDEELMIALGLLLIL